MSFNSNGRVVFLDYMRAFAFISVLVGHRFYSDIMDGKSDPAIHITLRLIMELAVPLCVGGAAGVVVFFLTSGYIITHVLQRESTTDFLVKRIFRIYPLYMFAVLAEAATVYFMKDIPFPPLSVMIPRLLLIGDFFDIQNSLAGVEWTLRIEIMFYAFMAIAKAFGAFTKQGTLPFIYLAVSIALYLSPSFPGEGRWNTAYVNSYSLFLLIGSTIYLCQKGLANRAISVLVVLILSCLFLMKIANVHPGWKDSNYAVIATGIFLAALYFGPRLSDSRILRLVSDLTFSVYLFHNWLWEFLAIPMSRIGMGGLFLKFAVALLLFAICYVLHVFIERAGLKLGKRVLSTVRSWGRPGIPLANTVQTPNSI